MRKFIIPEEFFKKIAEKGKLYSRIWIYWLGGFVDDIFETDFLEKQEEDFKEMNYFKRMNLDFSEIREIYQFGVQHLQQDFEIVDKKNKKSIPKEKKIIAEAVIDYLNERADREFTKKDSNLNLIVARINEGYTLDDFKFVIDKKIIDWKGTKFEQYIRPLTLFSQQFENYINLKNDRPKTSFDKFALSIAKAQSITFRGDE